VLCASYGEVSSVGLGLVGPVLCASYGEVSFQGLECGVASKQLL